MGSAPFDDLARAVERGRESRHGQDEKEEGFEGERRHCCRSCGVNERGYGSIDDPFEVDGMVYKSGF